MNITREKYREKLKAAMLSRFAGCTLGAPVEGWTHQRMKDYAAELGIAFPPVDYWPAHPTPDEPRYNETFRVYTRPGLDHVPSDDDIGYTFLSLLCVEEHGREFGLEDVAANWLKYMTISFTAEKVALANLKNGVPAAKAAEIDNPYSDWIGADIRCDGFGYMNPCDPETAVKMAETDARISHRGEGVYGEQYFASVIARGFGCDDPKKALTDALEDIPRDCELAKTVRYTFETADQVHSPEDAIRLTDARFPGMSTVHTLNNAMLTIYSLLCFGDRLTDIISNCVAMAHDCDCTAATAASIAGACYGMKTLDEHWTAPFGDRVHSYFNGPADYSIADLLARFEAQAVKGGHISA